MSRRLVVLLVGILLAAGSVPAGAQARTCTIEFPNTPATRVVTNLLPSGQRNTFVGGGVVALCRRDEMTIRSDSAEIYGDEGRVYLVGSVRYEDPRARMTSDVLNYYTADERAIATGHVDVRMASGSTMEGPEAMYLRATAYRPQQQLVATGRPTLRLREQERAGRPSARPDTTPTVVRANTITMLGDSLVYGSRAVEIERPDLNAQSESLFVDTGREFTRLSVTPRIQSRGSERPYELAGNLIDLYSRSKKLERVVARGKGTAVSEDVTLRADTIEMRVRDDLLQRAVAWGPGRARATSAQQDMTADSLDVRMPSQRLQRVFAVRDAYAESVPDTLRVPTRQRDWLRGDTITADFDTAAAPRPARAASDSAAPRPARDNAGVARAPGDTTSRTRIRQLVAVKDARSLYHLAPQDSAAREPALNYVRGDAITVRFAEGRVRQVQVVGRSTGIYLEPTVARADTAGTRRAQPGSQALPAAGPGRGAVPIPPGRPLTVPPRATRP